MHSTLPEDDSPTLGLVQPTKHEVQEMLEKSSIEWRAALSSSETYLRREQHLSAQSLTKSAGQTYWVLVDTALPQADRQVLAGCETIRKRALVARDGKVQNAISHAVGGVFCPPELRGRGYGARMMRELSVQLRTWQTDLGDSLFSTLYSDIGKRFYAKNGGWKVYPSAHLHLPPKAASTPQSTSQIKLLEAADLPELCALDEASIRSRLATRQGTGVAVALVPDLKILEWQHAREDFVADAVHGRVPRIKGAMTQLSDGRRVWGVWTRMFYNADAAQRKGNTLHIMRLATEEKEGTKSPDQHELQTAIAAVMSAAQEQAEEWMCAEVELWNPPPASVAAARELDAAVKVVERDSESITALVWYGPEKEEAGLEWFENEKFGWS